MHFAVHHHFIQFCNFPSSQKPVLERTDLLQSSKEPCWNEPPGRHSPNALPWPRYLGIALERYLFQQNPVLNVTPHHAQRRNTACGFCSNESRLVGSATEYELEQSLVQTFITALTSDTEK